jgi:hypothetical protein
VITKIGRNKMRVHDYADLRVMPTSAWKSLQTGVIGVSGLA